MAERIARDTPNGERRRARDSRAHARARRLADAATASRCNRPGRDASRGGRSSIASDAALEIRVAFTEVVSGAMMRSPRYGSKRSAQLWGTR
jgi:hypothetical protein